MLDGKWESSGVFSYVEYNLNISFSQCIGKKIATDFFKKIILEIILSGLITILKYK